MPIPARIAQGLGGAAILTHSGSAAGPERLLAGWNGAVLVTVGCSLLGALAVYFSREPSGCGICAEV